MPELPEVQTIVNDLNAAGLIGDRIRSVKVYWPGSIAEPPPRVFVRRLQGQFVAAIRRRGKYLVFDLAGVDKLLIHLRMSGRLNLVSTVTERSKHEHVILEFASQRQLRFQDTRKFGRLYLVRNPDKILGHLGPEPLAPGFTLRMLAEALRSRKRLLKPLLLDQTFIAGLGNIYVDEALWEAKIHPCRLSSSLAGSEIKALHRAVPRVLARGLQNFGTTLGTGETTFYSIGQNRGRNRDQLRVFRRTGLPCPRCQATIERLVVGQRSTHVCPRCQKL
ncbi:MAG: bifunctional DNA-formamidopyrimidine glycosylase/DNA-(apurinic or apyrimidinic site) lyase [Desulfobacterales bacterium]|nr:MAG: bifunctional DNA-formamidopyrimidine glycosylase/DNA-(apurinic or apyrimidinic site) lyase [Desulfobacterales bacterium]